jgi:hypothetical protein
MAVITDLADALVAELNAATFGQPIAAQRHYLPRFDLPEMQTLHVTVVPKGVVLGVGDRARGQGDYSVDVAVQQKITTGDNAELDALTNLVEEIANHLRGRRLASYPDAAWLKTEQTVLYAQEHLAELRQFTSVLTVTYRVLR